MATIAELLARSRDLLSGTGTPRLDSELLLGSVLGCDRSYLFTWPEQPVTEEQRAQYEALLQRRYRGEPVAHLVGYRHFWTLKLEVSPVTLIPRPETELLVELALKLGPATAAGVADLGTGSGAIALALASERPQWQVLAIDQSAEAVSLAERNRVRYALGNVEVRQGNWLAGVEESFALIVSNPPYIDVDDDHLSLGDLRFEPASALVAGQQGMAAIDTIIKTAVAHLVPGGWLMLEHGAEQGPASRRLMVETGYRQVSTYQDMAGLDRVTVGQSPCPLT